MHQRPPWPASAERLPTQPAPVLNVLAKGLQTPPFLKPVGVWERGLSFLEIMSTQRTKKGGYVSIKELEKGANGRSLCRECNTEVPPRQRSFCGYACIHRWKMKTSTAYVRQCVETRDKGVCAGCSIDTKELGFAFVRYQHEILSSQRESAIKNGITRLSREGWGYIERANLKTFQAWGLEYGIPPGRLNKSWWDADHILPVAEGGGECGIDNYQTLCLKCHRAKTTEQARRKALACRTSPLFA